MSKSTAEVLKEARAILVKDGWCQGWYEVDGKCCALGAIRRATGLVDFSGAAAWALANAIGVPIGSIHIWNDDPKRTKRQVLAVFTSAIRSESRKEQ